MLRLFGILLFSFAVFCPAPVFAAQPNRHNIDFSGNWELDYQRSDHVNEKVRRLYAQAKSTAERAMEYPDRRIDSRVLNYSSIIDLGRLAEKIAQATVLNIDHENDRIVVSRSDDFALICDFSDMGKKAGIIGAEGCTWDEDQLVFRIILPGGLHVLHRLSIAASRSRLNVATTVRVMGAYYPFTLNRVYMPFEPGEGQYQCEFTLAKQTTCTLRGSTE